MTQTPWQAQVAYYRSRAAVYVRPVQLRDGARHQLVKLVRDDQALTRQLTELGWHATITRSGADWLLGEARPALRS